MAANPIVVIGATGTLGGAAGMTLALENFGPTLLASVQAWMLTTATAGNRIFVLQVLDPSNNVLWSASPSAVVAASTTARFSFGSGIEPAAAPTGGQYIPCSISDQMVLPPGSQLTFFDQANIGANDSMTLFNALMAVGA
jgi:hypothetical protein